MAWPNGQHHSWVRPRWPHFVQNNPVSHLHVTVGTPELSASSTDNGQPSVRLPMILLGATKTSAMPTKHLFLRYPTKKKERTHIEAQCLKTTPFRTVTGNTPYDIIHVFEGLWNEVKTLDGDKSAHRGNYFSSANLRHEIAFKLAVGLGRINAHGQRTCCPLTWPSRQATKR